MTGEGRPSTPPRRPDTARRRAAEEVAGEPPSQAELLLIERHLVALSELSGAVATDDIDLGLTEVRRPGHGPALNYGALVRWRQEDRASRLREFAERYRAAGELPVITVAEGRSQPADLGPSLRAQGWVELERERVMWTRAAAVVPHLDPSLRVESVTARTAHEYEALERAIFGLSEAYAQDRVEQLRTALGQGLVRVFLVRAAGEPVATTRLTLREGVAGLYGVGVAEEHRHRGYGTLLTTIATRAGLAMGASLVWLSVDESNAPAVAMYRTLAFQPAFEWSRLIAVGGS